MQASCARRPCNGRLFSARLNLVVAADAQSIFAALVPYITIAGIVLSVILGIIGLWKLVNELKPHHKSPPQQLVRYIDYDSNEIVEEKEYGLHWGKWFSYQIKLPKIPRTSKYQLYYKPQTSFKQSLASQAYEEATSGSYRLLALTSKRFFEEAQCDSVCVHTSTQQNDQSYKSKVTSVATSMGISIENRNAEEIRNYPLSLPSGTGIDKLPDIVRNNSQNIVSVDTSDLQNIVVRIRSVPSAQGSSPGTLLIIVK